MARGHRPGDGGGALVAGPGHQVDGRLGLAGTARARSARRAQTLGLVEGWFRSQRGLAETLGEWAFYALAVLLILALSKRFPYHLFAKTHKLLAALYLVLVFHSLVLLTFDDWQQPMGWLLALLLAGGSVSALASLTGRIGRDRQVSGRVQDLAYSPALRVLATEVALDGPWPGHRAGQFAFVRYGRDGEPHPYTIASAWQPGDPALTFVTKALGDHTGRLPGRLRPGQTVRVEGPYGCFDFRDGKRRQIWVGAGIGITPFLAGLKARASQPDEVAVDLFHVTRDVDPVALDRLAADAGRRRRAPARLAEWARRPSGRGRDPGRGAGLAQRQPVVLRSRTVWPVAARRLPPARPGVRRHPPGAVSDALGPGCCGRNLAHRNPGRAPPCLLATEEAVDALLGIAQDHHALQALDALVVINGAVPADGVDAGTGAGTAGRAYRSARCASASGTGAGAPARPDRHPTGTDNGSRTCG